MPDNKVMKRKLKYLVLAYRLFVFNSSRHLQVCPMLHIGFVVNEEKYIKVVAMVMRHVATFTTRHRYGSFYRRSNIETWLCVMVS